MFDGTIHTEYFPFTRKERESMGQRYARLFVVKVDQDMLPSMVKGMIEEAFEVFNQDEPDFQPLKAQVEAV